MRVAVLGHRGMLGSVVARYMAEQGNEVLTTDIRYDGSDDLPRWASESDATMVVNCIKGGWPENAVLPHRLAATGVRLIQPSTDAIGETDDYSLAKKAGEVGVVIRAGLVDIRNQPQMAYPEWVCNPLTPLEWAKVLWKRVLDKDINPHGGYPIDRYSLAVMVADIFGGEPPILGHAEPKSRVLEVTHRRYIRDALLEYRAWLG